MKNLKRFALVFVLILSFGLIFTTGCNLFGGNGDGDGGKTTLTIDEIDDMISQNLFSHFSGVDLSFYLQKSTSESVTILFDGESLLQTSCTSTDGISQSYITDGMVYQIANKIKTEDTNLLTTALIGEMYLVRTGLRNNSFKINICEELITSNSVTETANGYKVKLVLNTTKAAELNVLSNAGFDADFTKYEITYEFNSQDKLVSVCVEAIISNEGFNGSIICSIKDYTGTVSAPAGFDPDEYTLFQP